MFRDLYAIVFSSEFGRNLGIDIVYNELIGLGDLCSQVLGHGIAWETTPSATCALQRVEDQLTHPPKPDEAIRRTHAARSGKASLYRGDNAASTMLGGYKGCHDYRNSGFTRREKVQRQ